MYAKIEAEDQVAVLSWYLSRPVFNPGHTGFRFRVYCREEKDFQFNVDYAEFFCGLNPREEDLIFDGEMTPLDGRKFQFRHEAHPGYRRTFVYWVAWQDESPVGPLPVRFRDPEVWWSLERISDEMEALAKEYPVAVLEVSGHTVSGLPVRSISIGNPNRRIGLAGAIHPGESGSELILPVMRRLVREKPELLEKVGVTALPVICMDQRKQMTLGNPWYLRKNTAGVDLNRNFPQGWEQVSDMYGQRSDDPHSSTFRGWRSGSEPETQAAIQWASSGGLEVVYVYHALASITGATGLAYSGGEQDRDYAAKAAHWMDLFADSFYQGEFTPRSRLRFTAAGGSFPAWGYHQLGIAIMDMEWDGNPDSVEAHSDLTTREMLALYQERHYRAVSGVLESMQ